MFARMDRLLMMAVACVLIWAAVAEAAISFQGLGFLPGGMPVTHATAISADGAVVVGDSCTAVWISPPGELPVLYYTPFRWTKQTGMVSLGNFAGGWPPGTSPGSDFGGFAYGMSADGSVVVGKSVSQPFVWTANGGLVNLGKLSPTDLEGGATAVTADGSVVYGFSGPVNNGLPFRWTAQGGMARTTGVPSAISADGKVMIGGSDRWTVDGTRTRLGFDAKALSADGSVVVGDKSLATGEWAAYRWTASTGTVRLGPFPGLWDMARAISADGSVIAGSYGYGAYIWDDAHGLRSLGSLLSDLGADVQGWGLEQVTAISPDGLTMIGNGINPAGGEEAWIATIPEPCGTLQVVTLAVLAGAHAVGRRVWVRR